MPAPMPAADDIRICQLCGGSGFLSPAIASIVTPDFRLQNMCPTCNGTGINEEVNERTPTQPYGESFDPDKTSGVQF
jgi:DnaJ-class molecular chaperone